MKFLLLLPVLLVLSSCELLKGPEAQALGHTLLTTGLRIAASELAAENPEAAQMLIEGLRTQDQTAVDAVIDGLENPAPTLTPADRPSK